MNSKQNFIETYENKIKPLRENYYKNQVQAGLGDNIFNKSMIIINYIPLILSISLCLVGSFSIKSKIIAVIFLFTSSYILAFIKKKYNVYESKYEIEIRKLGFLSINQYEKNIAKFITGEKGYYAEVLQNLIDKNKITEDGTYHLKDLKGKTYLIYNNKEKDEIYIINNNLKELPRITKIKNSNIRYYRLDKINKRIILKTDLDEWYYEEENEKIFNTIIPEKRIENQKEFKIESYIADFEKIMKSIKDKDYIKQTENSKIKETNYKNISLLMTLMIIIIILSYIYIDYLTILNVFYIIVIISINVYLQKYLQVKNITIKNDNEYIKYLNNNKECQDYFSELKLALNIPKEIDKIYSDEGAEFLVWDNAGYFHLFLNLIYFNVIYISVKIEDVEYYKEEEDYCELRIKEKSYFFNKEAKKTFDKLLPNKDYNWIKGLKSW